MSRYFFYYILYGFQCLTTTRLPKIFYIDISISEIIKKTFQIMIFSDRISRSLTSTQHHDERWNNSVDSSAWISWTIGRWKTYGHAIESLRASHCIDIDHFVSMVNLHGQILHPNPSAWFETFSCWCITLWSFIKDDTAFSIDRMHHKGARWHIKSIEGSCAHQPLEIISIDDVYGECVDLMCNCLIDI